jgi:hypothetical protein
VYSSNNPVNLIKNEAPSVNAPMSINSNNINPAGTNEACGENSLTSYFVTSSPGVAANLDQPTMPTKVLLTTLIFIKMLEVIVQNVPIFMTAFTLRITNHLLIEMRLILFAVTT